ncbi:hypothetical protein D3OALGB2SA_5650 [Olavius algarvensis associated proteobacterium Delta 3]|nr:hypothetical protein D3OALGB2SA_5650 [Olavius algarvensis associated proteobacterium Delta 3]
MLAARLCTKGDRGVRYADGSLEPVPRVSPVSNTSQSKVVQIKAIPSRSFMTVSETGSTLSRRKTLWAADQYGRNGLLLKIL